MHSHFNINVLSILSLAAAWETAGRIMALGVNTAADQIALAWWKMFASGKLLTNLGASLWTLAVVLSWLC